MGRRHRSGLELGNVPGNGSGIDNASVSVSAFSDDDTNVDTDSVREGSKNNGGSCDPLDENFSGLGTKSKCSDPNSWRSRFSEYLKTSSLPTFLHQIVLFVITPCLFCLVGFLLTDSESLPGGQIFTLLVLGFGGRILGYVSTWVKLPPMVGMLSMGLIIRNVPFVDKVGKNFDPSLSSFVRQIALAVILTRAGLGLDLGTLMKQKGLVLRLAVFPTVLEAICVALTSHFILDFPWTWSFLVGFVVAPVSPAVVVPRLLSLRESGYGVEKGIPTIIIAAASLDNIVAISLFGVSLGFTLVEPGSSTVMSILQGPLEIIMGLTAGVVWGSFMGLIFHSSHQNDRDAIVVRAVMTFCGGVICILGFRYFDYSGAGALSCLTSAVVSSSLWRKRRVFVTDVDIVCWVFYLLWFVFEPLLFGAIGCQIDVTTLEARIVLLGLICIVSGSVIRFIVTFLMSSKANLTVKEKLFAAISWSPKATVQAAIGPVALDTVRKMGRGESDETLGLQVLTIAVLTILLTAPLGELGVMLTGRKFLQRKQLL